MGAEKKPAGLVLKELREKLAADPAKYGPMFGPSKSEREYDAYVEARTKKQEEERAAKAAAAAAAAATAAAPKAGNEAGVAKTDKPKIEPKPVVTPEALAERERASAGRAGTFVPDEEPTADLVSSLGDSTATIRKGVITKQAVSAARQKSLLSGARKAKQSMINRAARAAEDVAAVKRAMETGTSVAQRKAVAQRLANKTAEAAGEAADMRKLQKFTTASEKAAAKAAKAAEAAAKAGNLAKSARLLGKFVSKAAVPLEVAMSAYEGVKLLTDEDQRRARKAEFEGYANRGALVSAGAAALNPVAGIYATGSALGDLYASRRGAAESAKNLRIAEDRQKELTNAIARGEIQKMTPELARQIRALPEKERIAFRKARNAQFAKFR